MPTPVPTSPPPPYVENDEITLKGLILKFKEFGRAVKRGWWLVLLLGAIGGGVFFLLATLKDTTYTAETEFMVKEEEGGAGALAGLSGILGNFGLGGARGGSNLDRILAIGRSDQIVYPALFDSTRIDGQDDLIANHIIRIYDLHESWNEKENPKWHDFRFTRGNLEAFNTHELAAMKSVAGIVRGTPEKPGILLTGYDEDIGFMRLRVRSLSEVLSQELMLTIYDRLSEFYVTRTIEPQQRAFDIIRVRKDSLENRVAYLNRRIAEFNQQNRATIYETRLIERQRLEQDRTITAAGLGEALRSYATSEFLLLNATPFLQYINQSVLPLEPEVPSKLVELIKGGLLGVLLAVLFLIGRKVYRNALQE